MAGTSERRVGRLRLAASSEAQARRGRVVLEDALNTATLPEAEGGRVLVVRSLALGKFRANRSPAGVALIIEHKVRELSARAVHALEPHAASAPAVYFRDAAEGPLALAARLARGGDVSEWFWPLAAPVWNPSLPREGALRRLLYAAAGAPEGGVVAAASMLRELRIRGGVGVMLGALGRADGPRLLRTCGWRQPPQVPPVAAPSSVVEEHLTGLGGGAGELAARWANAWGPEDARSIWLCALLLVEENPARLLDARLTSRAQRLIKRLTARDAPAGAKEAERISTASGVLSDARDHEDLHGRTDAAHAPSPENGAGERSQMSGPVDEDRKVEPTIPLANAEEKLRDNITLVGDPRGLSAGVRGVARGSLNEGAQLTGEERGPFGENAPVDGSRHARLEGDAPVSSAGAGLFFLVPVMSRLGVAALLEADPRLVESNFPRRLLRHVCGRVGVPECDPVFRVLGEEDETQTPRAEAAAKGVPASSPKGVRATTPALSPSLDETLPLDEWTRALRSWCRRRARIGLRELVRREGRLLWTRTHVDVLFDYRQLDFRIRRSALDIDPGWVSWLGRVVKFHYREQGDGDW